MGNMRFVPVDTSHYGEWGLFLFVTIHPEFDGVLFGTKSELARFVAEDHSNPNCTNFSAALVSISQLTEGQRRVSYGLMESIERAILHKFRDKPVLRQQMMAKMALLQKPMTKAPLVRPWGMAQPRPLEA